MEDHWQNETNLTELCPGNPQGVSQNNSRAWEDKGLRMVEGN